MAKKGKAHKGHEGHEGGHKDSGSSADLETFPHPSLAVDMAILTVVDGSIRALLLERSQSPEQGKWALPGGFVHVDESVDVAAARVLREKAGLRDLYVEQLYTFGDLRRDPRSRVVTVAYYALVPAERLTVVGVAGGEPAEMARLRVPWAGETGGPVEALDEAGNALEVAFDHADILGMAVKRLRGKLDYAPVGFRLLPDVFSLRSLQQIHEVISGRRLNKDSFRRRMLASGRLEATGERRTDVEYRPPELFRYTETPAE